MGDYGGYGGDYGDYSTNDGAGFLKQEGSSQGTPMKGGENKSKLLTVLPVTIKMLHDAQPNPDESYTISNKAGDKFCIYGTVTKIVQAATNTTYTVDDGTGVIDVNKWMDPSEGGGAPQMQDIHEGMLVCANGQIRSFNNKRSIASFRIYVCTDYNELTHHFLNVIVVNLYGDKGPLNQKLRPSNNPVKDEFSAMGGAGANNVGFNNPITNDYGGSFDKVQMHVLTAFQSDSNDIGRNIEDVVAELAQHGISGGEVRSAVEYLSNEGHLYSTIDEFHHKTTNTE